MTDTSEIRRSLVKLQEDQRKQEEELRKRREQERDRPAKVMIWWGWIVAGASSAVAALIVGWILGKPELVHMRETINPLVLSIGVAGAGIAGLGYVLLHLRRGQDARKADTEQLAQMVAEQQAIRMLLLRIEEKIDENEKQRRADFDMIREASVKRLDEIHDQIRRIDESLGGRLDYLTGLVRARDEAYVDLLSALEDAASKGDNVFKLRSQQRSRPAN